MESHVKAYLQALHQWSEKRTIFVDISVRRIILKGVVYAIAHNVVVTKDDDPRGTPCKAKIKEFIYHRMDEKVKHIFCC
jgi:hypothetical protein